MTQPFPPHTEKQSNEGPLVQTPTAATPKPTSTTTTPNRQPTSSDPVSNKPIRTHNTKLYRHSVGLAHRQHPVAACSPNRPDRALHRPPMPCVAVTAGVYPVGAGLLPGTAGAIDWYKIPRQLDAAGRGTTGPKTAHQTASPDMIAQPESLAPDLPRSRRRPHRAGPDHPPRRSGLHGAGHVTDDSPQHHQHRQGEQP